VIEPTRINGCYVSTFLENVVTIRNKYWDKIKDAFSIPKDPLELEKKEIYLLHKNKKRIKYQIIETINNELFSYHIGDK